MLKAAKLSVGDVFQHGLYTVKEEEPLSRCLELFKNEMPPVLAVVDEEDKYRGVITRRAVLRARLDPATTKVKTLMQAAPKVSPETSIGKVARLMI